MGFNYWVKRRMRKRCMRWICGFLKVTAASAKPTKAAQGRKELRI